MKKLLCLLTLVSLICTSAFASGITTLYEEDFENTGELTAVQYMAQSENIEEPKVTNAGLESIDFSDESGSKTLKFTGRSVDYNGNASKAVNFVFDEPYTLASFPNTKLVVSFTEYITKADLHSYTHTMIQGDGKPITQMFWANTVGEGPTYRCNNNGALGKKSELNKKLESTYIIDMETKTFDFIFDGTTYSNAAFNGQGASVTQIDTLRFEISKGHEFSVDDIKVYAMPKDTSLEIIEASLNGDESVNVESDFTAKLSAYVKNTNAVTVTANGETVDTSKYTINQKYVNEDGGYVLLTVDFKENLDYLTDYKVIFGAELANIMGTTLGTQKEFTFKTEREAKAYIDTVECYSGFLNGAEKFETLADARNKYVTFNITVSNDFVTEKNAAVFVECVDADGNTTDNGFATFVLSDGTETMAYSTYISDDVSAVKVYVKNSVVGGKTISDIASFE